jgi:predicted aspartyl protease
MIAGIVRGRDALVRLTIRGLRGVQQEIEAVVDSGYTGWLTLPPSAITALTLRWQTFGRGILADGSVNTFDVYQAKVLWEVRSGAPALPRAALRLPLRPSWERPGPPPTGLDRRNRTGHPG